MPASSVATSRGAEKKRARRHPAEAAEDVRARLVAAPARAVFARLLEEHQYTDLLEHASSKCVLIECLSRYPSRRQFRCYVGDSQAAALRSLEAPLTCAFPLAVRPRRAAAGTLRRGGQALGEIVRDRAAGDHRFEVNGETLLTLRTTGGQQGEGFCRYRLQLGDQAFDHQVPVWSRKQGQHTLKYDILNTRRVGIASCKNFRMDMAGKSVLEVVRISRSQMLVGVAPPFNAFIAAVVGIARFRA